MDYKTGAVKVDFEPSELLHMFPELGEIANFDATAIARVFSEDMRFAHYPIMAKAIEKEVKKGVDGIILTHGTDAMHYSSAALAFMLENLPVPVIIVGAQRSSDRGSSDAAMNLLCAATFIAKTDFAGVAICMHENSSDGNCVILPACKTRKLHTSRRDAFRPVNDSPIARIYARTGQAEFLKKDYAKKGQGNFAVKSKFDEKVGLLKCHPNMNAEEFLFYKKHKYNGLVIEGTGLGQAPVGTPNKEALPNRKNMKAIQSLVTGGCVVVMASQCIFGRVHMHVYDNAVDLANAGVLSAEDMTSETAFIKLAWLLGNCPKKEVAALVGKNLRGEISDRTEFDENFLEG